MMITATTTPFSGIRVFTGTPIRVR